MLGATRSSNSHWKGQPVLQLRASRRGRRRSRQSRPGRHVSPPSATTWPCRLLPPNRTMLRGCYNLCLSHQRMVEVAQRAGDSTAAIQHCRSARGPGGAIGEGASRRPTRCTAVVITHSWLSNFQTDAGQLDQAAAEIDAAAALADSSTRPNDAVALRPTGRRLRVCPRGARAANGPDRRCRRALPPLRRSLAPMCEVDPDSVNSMSRAQTPLSAL